MLVLTVIVFFSLFFASARGLVWEWLRRRRQRRNLTLGEPPVEGKEPPMSSALAVPLTGILVASACALLGNFLILRRMAMMSDAISHAILPGLVAGTSWRRDRTCWPVSLEPRWRQSPP